MRANSRPIALAVPKISTNPLLGYDTLSAYLLDMLQYFHRIYAFSS